MQFAAQPFANAHTEDISHLVSGQAEQPHFTGMLKDLVDREVPFEDEIAAVFDLIDRVVAAQIHGLAILLGELRSQQPTPVVQTLLDEVGAELVSGRLQCLWVRSREERVVIFTKR